MNKALRRKITEKVTELFNEAGVLLPNQTVKITIAIVDVPQVSVEEAGREDDAAYLDEIVSRMPTKSVRMKNIINRCDLTLSGIKSKSLTEMMAYRNLSKLTLKEFRQVLHSEDINCPWMNELATEDLDRLSIDELGLSIRSVIALRNNGFEKVGDFRHKTLGELKALRGFGIKAAREVRDAMLKRGINLVWFS